MHTLLYIHVHQETRKQEGDGRGRVGSGKWGVTIYNKKSHQRVFCWYRYEIMVYEWTNGTGIDSWYPILDTKISFGVRPPPSRS